MLNEFRDIKNATFSLLTWGLLAYIILLLAWAPWPFIDYIFSPLFHIYISSIVLFAVLYVINIVFRVLKRTGSLVPEEKIGPAVLWIFKSADAVESLLRGAFSLYCLSILVAALSLDPVFGLCALVPIAISGTALKIMTDRGVRPAIKFFTILPVCITLFALGAESVAGIPAKGLTISFLLIFMCVAYFKRDMLPLFIRATAWRNIVENRKAALAAGLLIFPLYFSWIPGLNSTIEAPEITQSSKKLGGGAGIELANDGVHLAYLNKKKSSVDWIDRATLEKEGTLGVFGYPRQMAYDREKGLFYVVVYGAGYKQLVVIDDTVFRQVKAVSLPHNHCAQANAVAIDRERGRILVGCDDSGKLFFIDRETLSDVEAPTESKPKGRGMVRIEIDEQADTAFTFGCFLGPFINEIDLEKGKLVRSKLTGYLIWESLRDDLGKRLFMSVPFRSIIAVISQNDLEVERVIRSGFGARALAVDRKGNRLFVGSQISSVVEIYDLETLELKSKFFLPFPRYFSYDDREGILYAAGTAGLYRIKI